MAKSLLSLGFIFGMKNCRGNEVCSKNIFLKVWFELSSKVKNLLRIAEKLRKLKRVCFRVFSNFEILHVLRKCSRELFPHFWWLHAFSNIFERFAPFLFFFENFQFFDFFCMYSVGGDVFTFLTVFFRISDVNDAFHHLFERFAPLPGFLKI